MGVEITIKVPETEKGESLDKLTNELTDSLSFLGMNKDEAPVVALYLAVMLRYKYPQLKPAPPIQSETKKQ